MKPLPSWVRVYKDQSLTSLTADVYLSGTGETMADSIRSLVADIRDRADELEACLEESPKVDRAREQWLHVLAEVEKTRQWRASTGMKTGHDCGEFAGMSPHGLTVLERLAREALGEAG